MNDIIFVIIVACCMAAIVFYVAIIVQQKNKALNDNNKLYQEIKEIGDELRVTRRQANFKKEQDEIVEFINKLQLAELDIEIGEIKAGCTIMGKRLTIHFKGFSTKAE